jgi:hypothetical protein
MRRLHVALVVLGMMSMAPALADGINDKQAKQPTGAIRVVASLGKGCRISAYILPSEQGGLGCDPNTGYGGIGINPLPKQWHSRLESVGFSLTCLDAEKVAGGDNTVTFDPQTGTWKKDVAKRVRAYGFEMSPKEYRETYEDQDKAIRVYNVTAVNAKGFASTIDDTIGEEKKRLRRTHFCLYHQTKALCGSGDVGYVAYGPKSDLTQRALEIIRSIEFLPDEE